MRYIHAGVVIGVIAIIAYFGWNFYKSYQAATGSPLARAISAAKDSATILWARFVALIGLLVLGLSSLAEILGAPGVATAIQQYLTPQVAGAVLVGAMIISEWARKRTL